MEYLRAIVRWRASGCAIHGHINFIPDDQVGLAADEHVPDAASGHGADAAAASAADDQATGLYEWTQARRPPPPATRPWPSQSPGARRCLQVQRSQKYCVRNRRSISVLKHSVFSRDES